MNSSSQQPDFKHQAVRAAVAALLSGVSALSLASDTSSLTAQSYAADAAFSTGDFGTAYGAVAQAMQLMPAGTTTPTSVPCPSGGSVNFSVAFSSASGSSTPLPIYTVQFNQCALSSAIVVNGNYTKTVTSQSTTAATKSNGWVMTTSEEASNSYNQISVSMPYGALLLAGNDTTKSLTTKGLLSKVNTSKVEHLITDPAGVSLSTSHTFSERASAYALMPTTDVTYATTSTAGVTGQTTVSGVVTLVVSPYMLAQVGQIPQLTFVMAFTDTVTFDPSGQVNNGAFSLITPASTRYVVTVGGGQFTVCVDKGNDGTVEGCFGPVPALTLNQ